MDESDEDESSDDDLTHKEPSVIIEDITDQEVRGRHRFACCP